MTTHVHHRNLLVWTNVAYVIPAMMTIYQMTKKRGHRMNKYQGMSFICLFLFISFFSSWCYHSCQCSNDIRKVCYLHRLSGSDNEPTMEILKYVDYFIALFTLMLLLVHVLPLSDAMKLLCINLSVIWFTLWLMVGFKYVASAPVVIIFVLALIFWIMMKTNPLILILLLLCIMISLICYASSPGEKYYWVIHSLWHVFSALTLALLLYQYTCCHDNLESKLPRKFFRIIHSIH